MYVLRDVFASLKMALGVWLSDKWDDYKLIDCSGGEKLERWGAYTLVRPDPQVIWNTPKEHPRWQNPDARYERSQSGGGQWRKSRIPASWQVSYSNFVFNLSLMNFKHTGLFPEQAVNWDYITGKIHSAISGNMTGSKHRPGNGGGLETGINVLNLFAYTGGATIAAAAAGANVCHVDAARGMVMRAKENAKASGLEDKPIRWIVDDCAKFVGREIRRGHRYDALIMDPPSYGRGPSGEIWKLEDELYDFIKLCSGVLSDDPLFVLINSYTTGLAPSTLTYITQSLLGGYAESSELGLPVTNCVGNTDRPLALPCGATCRWTASGFQAGTQH
jgi:23S rRNA (cytosine1962-C5)-methyltransferase